MIYSKGWKENISNQEYSVWQDYHSELKERVSWISKSKTNEPPLKWLTRNMKEISLKGKEMVIAIKKKNYERKTSH